MSNFYTFPRPSVTLKPRTNPIVDQIEILYQFWIMGGSVARAFPGGRVTHPEGQNEEEN